jgi:hypothetical protein
MAIKRRDLQRPPGQSQDALDELEDFMFSTGHNWGVFYYPERARSERVMLIVSSDKAHYMDFVQGRSHKPHQRFGPTLWQCLDRFRMDWEAAGSGDGPEKHTAVSVEV